MAKHKAIKKLSKLKLKYNELLLTSLSNEKFKRYKNRYDFLIAVPFLLCVIHFTTVAPLIVNVAPIIRGIIGAILVLSNVICPICYINYKEKCEARLKEKIDKISKKINKYENLLNTNKKNLEVTTKTKEKTEPTEDILFQDFPELHITEETRRQVLEHPELHSGLSVRARMGKFYTDDEWAQRREEVLNTPLPGEEEKGPRLVKKRIPSKNPKN